MHIDETPFRGDVQIALSNAKACRTEVLIESKRKIHAPALFLFDMGAGPNLLLRTVLPPS